MAGQNMGGFFDYCPPIFIAGATAWSARDKLLRVDAMKYKYPRAFKPGSTATEVGLTIFNNNS